MSLEGPDGAIGEHIVEECVKLTELRVEVDKEQNMGEWWTRHLRGIEKRKLLRHRRRKRSERGRK